MPNPSAPAGPRASAPRGTSLRQTVTFFRFLLRQASPRVTFAALREGKHFSISFTAFWLRSLQCQRRRRQNVLKFKEMPQILRFFSQKPKFMQIPEGLTNRTDTGRTVSPPFLRGCDFLQLSCRREPFLAGPGSLLRLPRPLAFPQGPAGSHPAAVGAPARFLNPSVNF